VADEVILINVFELPAIEAERFIAAWERTRDYLQTQPGTQADTTPVVCCSDRPSRQTASIGQPTRRSSSPKSAIKLRRPPSAST
jgi:hypothetical protein